MFQFGGFPSVTYLFSYGFMILHHVCSHIRISAAHSLFAAPRSFSQLVTSFIGSQCQGILHMLFFAWTTLKYSILFVYPLIYIGSHRLNCCVSYLQWISFDILTKLFSFTLNRKTWFRFHDIFVFPFTFVCHVCHTNSFELICYKFLFGFQWTFRLTLSN